MKRVRPRIRPMKSMTRILLLAVVAGPALGQSPAAAQDQEPKRHHLESQDVTSERLIDILQPKVPKPARLRTRSLTTPEPDCDHLRQQLTRGIGLKPVADIPAMGIHFALDSAELLPAATQALDAIGTALTSADLAPCCFKLEGHTDSSGSDDYNLELSRRRAASVASYLQDRFGIQVGRLLTAGRGEAYPIADNASDQGRKKNRRVEIVNLGYGRLKPE